MEVAAELQDMVESDLVKVYPDLVKDVHIAVIELQDHVLSTYDRRISDYTKQIFTRYVSGSSVRGTSEGVNCSANVNWKLASTGSCFSCPDCL